MSDEREPHGPYFPGQKSSAPCGHFYPDVMRMFDFRGKTGVYWRVCYCGVCKRHFRCKIDAMAFSEDVGVLVSTFEMHRKAALKRIKERV